ncbi:MAG TPA: DUF167 domain-containing protein [Longimicrobiales bacterium]|nr:DUF167 domain-containing protein [Longimicrobiales bacterium]
MLPVEDAHGRTRFRVRVVPRASRTEVAGEYAGALRVRLAAPPVDGKANAALIRFLSSALSVPRAEIRIVRGESSRSKTVEVDAPPADVRRALETLVGRG